MPNPTAREYQDGQKHSCFPLRLALHWVKLFDWALLMESIILARGRIKSSASWESSSRPICVDPVFSHGHMGVLLLQHVRPSQQSEYLLCVIMNVSNVTITQSFNGMAISWICAGVTVSISKRDVARMSSLKSFCVVWWKQRWVRCWGCRWGADWNVSRHTE